MIFSPYKKCVQYLAQKKRRHSTLLFSFMQVRTKFKCVYSKRKRTQRHTNTNQKERKEENEQRHTNNTKIEEGGETKSWWEVQ